MFIRGAVVNTYKCVRCGRESLPDQRAPAEYLDWSKIEPTAPKFEEVSRDYRCPTCQRELWIHSFREFGYLRLTKLCNRNWVRCGR